MSERSDALVIGSGIAALSYALEASARGRTVTIVTKRTADEANTAYAQGGIAAVLRPEDSFEAHVEDTLRAGAGLCRRDIVELVVAEGPRAVQRLIDAGVRFDKSEGHEEPSEPGAARPADAAGELGEYDLTREGGHSHRRILHASDITGREIMRGLLEALRARSNVRILEHHCAVDLVTTRKVEGLRPGPRQGQRAPKNRCLGAYVLDEVNGRVETFLATTTLIATGGASKVYLYTSNPDIASGDGIAMAWRAGAEVANMEFIQFHPTCLFHPAAKSFLISEALRGEGGILRRKDGTRFMESYHPMKELAPRDIVARAIDTELKRTGDDCVFLDMTHLDPGFLERRFPNIHAKCLELGIDLRKQPIPVVPAAHYVCGGVRCDREGETTIPGLFVAGESACTGLHGANRLASNSLLEAAVFGHRAALSSERWHAEAAPDFSEVPEWNVGNAVPSDELVVISQCWDEIRRFMWNYVGIVRSDRRLKRAERRIATLREEIREFYWYATVTRDLLELRNICTVAELIVACALKRKESRGLHYTIDYPSLANEPPGDTILRRDDLV
ncbi:L-aspartate oxidase [Myxococcota bacterium]|nr:L-aspartate oxidase [Myxococcota bacterium]